MKLSELLNGESATIVRVEGNGVLRKRITEMGFVRGKSVKVIKNAPLKDPIEYEIMGYDLSLRRAEADKVIVASDSSHELLKSVAAKAEIITPVLSTPCNKDNNPQNGVITVALAGNPNSGKTSLFNYICGLDEHVGNYSGVTVDSKEAFIEFKGYSIRFTDLPGTYSLSSYSLEEKYMQDYLRDNRPDVILNIIDSSNLERNLYLTTQLIDLNIDMVVSLNMYDELQSSGSKLKHNDLGELLNAPFIPTIAKRGKGVPHILKAIVDTYERESDQRRSVKINYGTLLEEQLQKIEQQLEQINTTPYNNRFVAIKLLEGDRDIYSEFANSDVIAVVKEGREIILKEFGENCETVFADARYGFISGALKETYKQNISRKKQSEAIDNILTHQYWGLPIFTAIMWCIFWGTFTFAEYPVMAIEWMVEQIQLLCIHQMSDGAFKDLVVDGIIGGVGSVVVFLPNILLLFLFISFLEDSGYMARAAFIMDKLMHKIGLHGKSFIPLIMGFGCNVPAIMSTRIIEDKNNRLLTMLIVPFMSCSARLPVYILIVSAFFPEHSSNMLFLIYLIGVLMAIFTSLLFKKLLFNKKDLPFVMELPPYRIPTAKSIVKHMWQKGSQYLQKMGGIILVAVVIIWVLSYYPKKEFVAERYTPQVEAAHATFNRQIEQGVNREWAQKNLDSTVVTIDNTINFEHASQSYLGRVGQFVEPVFKPLGFDWKLSVGLLSGIAAKEIVVSTLGVLHNVDNSEEDMENLGQKLKMEKYSDGRFVYSRSVALSFLMFVLIYFPCIAVITAIHREGGSVWWAVLSVVYTSLLAWVVSFVVYNLF